MHCFIDFYSYTIVYSKDSFQWLRLHFPLQPSRVSCSIFPSLQPSWCYGNASTRNQAQKKQKPPQNEIFWGVFCFFQKLSEIPQIQFLEEFPVFFLSVSLIFRSDFGLSGSYIVEGFPKIFEGFPIIFDPFTHFWGSFPVFRKSLKFLVCWMVSSFFDSVSSFFWIRFRFSEKVVNFQFIVRFPLFLGPFPVF